MKKIKRLQQTWNHLVKLRDFIEDELARLEKKIKKLTA